MVMVRSVGKVHEGKGSCILFNVALGSSVK